MNFYDLISPGTLNLCEKCPFRKPGSLLCKKGLYQDKSYCLRYNGRSYVIRLSFRKYDPLRKRYREVYLLSRTLSVIEVSRLLKLVQKHHGGTGQKEASKMWTTKHAVEKEVVIE